MGCGLVLCGVLVVFVCYVVLGGLLVGVVEVVGLDVVGCVFVVYEYGCLFGFVMF